MFISKSKKGLKPKAPSRRGAEAIAAVEAPLASSSRQATPRESTPNPRPAEPIQDVGTDNALASKTQPEKPIDKDVHQLAKDTTSDTQQVKERAPTATTQDVRNQREKTAPIATRFSRRIKTSAPVQQGVTAVATRDNPQQNTPLSASTLGPTASGEPVVAALLSPPPTQAIASVPPAGSFIRKPKKIIKQRDATGSSKRTAESPILQEDGRNANEEAQVLAIVQSADTGSTTADVENRLVTALQQNGFTPINPATLDQASAPVPTDPPERANKKTKRQSQKAKTAPVIDGAAAQLAAESAAADAAEPQAPITKRGRKRKQPTETEEADVAAGVSIQAPRRKKRARVAKPKKIDTTMTAQVIEADGVAASEINSDNEVVSQPSKNSRKRKRAGTPEDAANMVIAPDEITMAALTVDQHQGKISIRETRLRERDSKLKKRKLDIAQAKARGELEEFMNDPANSVATTPSRRRTLADIEAQQSRSISPDAPAAAPQFRIVNGQIVQDESSRVIDRRAERQRAAEADDENGTIIEEDDLSRRINSRSFTKYDKPSRWDDEQTALFHKGLQYFGLEFSMMACLFPGRTRRQLKAKFIREERADIQLVNSLLRDKQPIPDRAELEELMGKKLKDPKDLEAELQAQKEALEEAQRVEDAILEERRLEREREASEEGKRVKQNERDDSGDGDDDDGDNNDDEEADEEEAESDGHAEEEEEDG